MKYVIIILALLTLFILFEKFQSSNYYVKKSTEKVDRIKDTQKNEINTTKGVKLESDKTIKELWEKLFRYYNGKLIKKCQGATEEKIAEVEKVFNVKLPKEFADSFRVCDERYILDTSKKRGWFGEDDIYSLSNTKYNWYNLFQVNRQIATYAQDIGWNKNWIQFYDYGTWFSAVLDTTTGTIYCYDNETGDYVVWSNSYKEWFEMAVNEVLKHGEIRLEPIEKMFKPQGSGDNDNFLP